MIYTVIAGVVGGVLRSILGYAEQEEEFNWKKSLKSLIRAGVGGIALAVGLGITVIDIQTFLIVVLACAGIDTVWHDAYKAATKK